MVEHAELTTVAFETLVPEAAPIAGSLGAEIRGIEVSPDLTEADVRWIRSRVLEHKVVFFRDQLHLDDAALEGFCERFDTLARQPVRNASGTSPASMSTRRMRASSSSRMAIFRSCAAPMA